jgi:hypothetical protein
MEELEAPRVPSSAGIQTVDIHEAMILLPLYTSPTPLRRANAFPLHGAARPLPYRASVHRLSVASGSDIHLKPAK